MKVAIIGAGGLTGQELLRLLKNHPEMEVCHITSNKTEGKTIEEVFPTMGFQSSLKFQNHNSEIPKDALVVLAVPNEVSLEMSPKLLDKGYKVLDISGAYRLHNQDVFEKFYGLKHNSFHLMDKVQYGIPEIFREKIKRSHFVSNPGCYATSVILPIFMLGKLREEIQSPIVVNSASGVSGAGGRTEDIGFTFTNTYENFRAYKILNHQHTPEMEEYAFQGMEKTPPKIIFTPHLLPVYRGILSTFVIHFSREISESELKAEFGKFASEEFIRLLPNPEDIELKKVQNSNYIDFSYRIQGKTLVIVSALDNLQKGASGQALQNMNLMCGKKESLGLVRSIV
jgi:N-acetyl-gamma-glutamyl-phosphate reductase